MALIEDACRAHLEGVADPVLREKLRPDYRAGCKRLIASGEFYDAIQRPNAALVTEQIERIEPAGVRTEDGVLNELDVLVLATGVRADRFLRPIEVRGRDGMARRRVGRLALRYTEPPPPRPPHPVPPFTAPMVGREHLA